MAGKKSQQLMWAGSEPKKKDQILEKYAHSADERRQNFAAETASDDNKFRRKNSERRQEICRKRRDSRATIIEGKPNRARRSDVI
jgi:acyl-CoA reductase-like NAD-dependent aldehyde dehydrogenase